MCLRNTETSYGSVTKFLHWIILLLVFAMLGYGSLMGYFPKPLKPLVYNIHKLTGLLVLTLVILFCLWSLINTKPIYTDMRLWEKKLADSVRINRFEVPFCLIYDINELLQCYCNINMVTNIQV